MKRLIASTILAWSLIFVGCAKNPVDPGSPDQQLSTELVTENLYDDEGEEYTASKEVGGNVDPRYNITCVPGQWVMRLSVNGVGGVYFQCRADVFTRAYELHNLKQEAVTEDLHGYGILSWLGWFLNLVFDDTLRINRYMQKIANYEADATEYSRRVDDYRQRANNTRSRSRRREYHREADKYQAKANRAHERANEYRRRVEDITRELDSRAPENVDIRVNWTS